MNSLTSEQSANATPDASIQPTSLNSSQRYRNCNERTMLKFALFKEIVFFLYYRKSIYLQRLHELCRDLTIQTLVKNHNMLLESMQRNATRDFPIYLLNFCRYWYFFKH